MTRAEESWKKLDHNIKYCPKTSENRTVFYEFDYQWLFGPYICVEGNKLKKIGDEKSFIFSTFL